jgi:hypothetical protein
LLLLLREYSAVPAIMPPANGSSIDELRKPGLLYEKGVEPPKVDGLTNVTTK